MYMFFSYSDGYIPMGNDGQIKVPSSVRSECGLVKLADSFRGNRNGRVYLMTSWTQKMSELGPIRFEEYIMRNGRVLSHS